MSVVGYWRTLPALNQIVNLLTEAASFLVMFAMTYFSKRYRQVQDRVLNYPGPLAVSLLVVVFVIPLGCAALELFYIQRGDAFPRNFPVVAMSLLLGGNCAALLRLKQNGKYIRG